MKPLTMKERVDDGDSVYAPLFFGKHGAVAAGAAAVVADPILLLAFRHVSQLQIVYIMNLLVISD